MNSLSSDTILIIPAYNNADKIREVLYNIQQSPSYARIIDIIVVDNNSNDQTVQYAKEAGAMVIHEPKQGYGYACLNAINKAYEISCTFIIFFSPDESNNPHEFRLFFEKLDQGSDLVVGSRVLGKPISKLPLVILPNRLLIPLIKIVFKNFNFTDMDFNRAIRTDALKQLDMHDYKLGWRIEMQIKATMYQLNCTEVSTNYKKAYQPKSKYYRFFISIQTIIKSLWVIFYLFIRSKRLKV